MTSMKARTEARCRRAASWPESTLRHEERTTRRRATRRPEAPPSRGSPTRADVLGDVGLTLIGGLGGALLLGGPLGLALSAPRVGHATLRCLLRARRRALP